MEEGTGLSPISDDLTRWLAEYWRQAVNDIRNEGIQSASDLRHTVQVITGLPSSFLDGRGYSVNAAIAETLDSYVGGIKAPDGYNCVIANYLGSSLAETISDDGCSEAAFHMAYAFLDDNDDVLRSFWQAFLRLAYASPDGDAFHQKATSAFISFMVTNWTDFIPRYARDSLTSRQEGASEGLSLSSFWEDDWTSIPIHIALMPILECLFRLDNTMVLNALDSLREPMLALYLIEKCLASTTLEEFSSAIRLAPLMRADDRTLAWNGSLVLPSMLRVFVDDCINSATNELSSLRGNPASPRIDIPDIIQSATREAELTLGCLVTRPDAPLAFSFLMLELAFSLLSRFSGRGSDADVVGLVTDRLLRIGALIASRERFDQELCRKVAAIVDKQRLYLSATFCSALFLCEDAKNSSAGIENFLNDFTAFLNEASEDNDLYLPDSTLSEGAFSTALGTIISYSDSPSDVVNEALIGLSEVLWRSRFITNPQAALRSHLVLFESSLQAIRSIADLSTATQFSPFVAIEKSPP